MGLETIGLMAAGSLATSVAGGVTGAAGSIMKGQAESASAQYMAAVARNNSQIALTNAQRSRETGDLRAMAEGLKTGAMLGKQTATQAANGLDVNVGSPVDVRASTAELGRLDALTIAHNASKEAFGSEVQSTNFLSEARLRGMAAKNAEDAGTLGAFTSLLGGASSFGDKWMSFNAKGVKGY